jgi:hypothetical protein
MKENIMICRKLFVALLFSLASTAVLYGAPPSKPPEDIDCPTGTSLCAINANYGKWGCFNLSTSSLHCGDCEIKCPTGKVCKAGQCVFGAIPPTPNPTYSFDTAKGPENISIGGSPADSNIAVSSTHICLTARDAFACYTKGGTLVNPGVGFSVRPYEARDFFVKSGVPDGKVASGTLAKDGRIVFDRNRKRFFMAFQTREEHPRLLIAVSKSEDPRDGWWTYADNVEEADVNGQDYMWIGINASHFLVSNQMSKCTGTYGTNTWMCTFVRTRHLMYTAADLAAGKQYSRGEWSHVNGNNAVPCVHNSTTTDAFWIHRDDARHVTVWAVRNGKPTSRQVAIQPSSAAVNGIQSGNVPLIYDQFGGSIPPPLNAELRDGKIVFVSNDGYQWPGQPAPTNSIRLVRLNVSKYFDASPIVTVEIDRLFGGANANDSSGALFDYGWPAVASNGDGDIVIGFVRSNPTIFFQQRAHVWSAGQADISSHVLLKQSQSALSSFHMAGSSADPSTNAVYLSQQVVTTAASPSWVIHVTKMLGTVQPDLIATRVQAPGTIAPGASGSVTVTVMNQGDGPMPASQGWLCISNSNVIHVPGPEPVYAFFSVPALAPSQTTSIQVPFTIPAGHTAGQFYLGVVLDTMGAAGEASETNNQNPFVAGDHGNTSITIK